jgi:hypothetical protein
MKKKAKQQPRASTLPGGLSGQSLVGEIFHCSSGVTMTQNTFCVVLRETSKSVLLAELNTGLASPAPSSGYERPFLQDGAAAANAIEEIFRVVEPRIEGPQKTTTIARLRIDPKYLDPHEVNEAIWLQHVHQREVGHDSVIVRVFHANKVIAPNGSLSIRHRGKRFSVWDGQPKYYDHND